MDGSVVEVLKFVADHPEFGIGFAMLVGGVATWFGIKRMVISPIMEMNHELIEQFNRIKEADSDMAKALQELSASIKQLSGMEKALRIVAGGGDDNARRHDRYFA